MVRSACWSLALFALTCAACDDFREFRGTYQAEIVAGNFVRSCFASGTELTLVFDPDKAVAPLAPGELNTVNTLSTSDGTFQSTVLEPIGNLPHDSLSELDFPGPQRLRNYLLLARPNEGPLAGRDALVVISLLASEQVEVRVIARSADGMAPCPGEPDSDAGEAIDASGRREYFGIWRMKQR